MRRCKVRDGNSAEQPSISASKSAEFEKAREIRRLANTTEMTLHEISEVVGVHNIGRVSEVLNGKR
jgi:hypothetical protein